VTRSDDPRPANSQEWDFLHDVADQLEDAWKGAENVDLNAFLPPRSDPRRRLLALHELIKTDLEIRWRRKQGRTLEDYTREYPDLGKPSTLPAQLIYEEYRARRLYGDQPELPSYRQRFPDQYRGLQDLVRAHPVATGFETIQPPTPSKVRSASHPSQTDPAVVETPTPPAEKPASSRTVHLPTPPTAAASPKPPAEKPIEVLRVGEGYEYELFQKIGRGQFGEVFRARAPGGVLVAVKRIFRNVDDESSKRELAALELLRDMRNPFLLQTHSFWPRQDRLYIVMELADGSLADWVEEYRKNGDQRIPAKELLAYFRQAAEGLDFLHKNNVMHRDIKPANLLRMGGFAKVADFGLAREQSHDMSMTAGLFGTPIYMPPEMWKAQIHKNSDQYSLAVAYAECRLGRRCFSGTSQWELQQQHMMGQADLAPLKEAEQRVLRRALARNPDDRYPSCVEFVEALTEAVLPPKERFAGSRPPLSKVLVAAGGLGLTLLMVLLWVVFLRPTPAPARDKPSWQPLGWAPPAGEEELTEPDLSNKRYYKKLVRDVGGERVVMIAIPQKTLRDPQTYYIMENKVSNRVFEAVMAEKESSNLLKTLRELTREPLDDVIGKWKLGALGGGRDLGVDRRGAYPVMRVSALEAHCVAERLGGRLPTPAEWEKAAGYGEDGRQGPYDPSPENGIGPGVQRSQEGPLPVGEATRDKSIYGLHDVAGNGSEWTRLFVGESGQMVPALNVALTGDELVNVVGKSYTAKAPLHFKEVGVADALGYNEVRFDVGFRIVLEQS
jgi:serine/threonine protein kinase